jgi:hypothetical protein
MQIDNSKDTKLSLVYSSKNGTEFYSYVDPLQISTLRGVAAEKAKRFLDMNLTSRSLSELVKEIKREAGAGDIVKAFSIIQEIEFRQSFLCEESSILDLVCIYFFLKDEDPEEPSEAFNKKKHKIFEQDTECRAFFLRIGLVLCKKFSPKQEEDMLIYLEENRMMSERIRRYIAPESLIHSTNG